MWCKYGNSLNAVWHDVLSKLLLNEVHIGVDASYHLHKQPAGWVSCKWIVIDIYFKNQQYGCIYQDGEPLS